MPNSTAYLMLALWPLVAFVLFRRLPVERAVIWTILGGYLVLPPLTAYDWPLLPPMDKVLVPNILALAGVLLVAGRRVPWMPASRLARGLAVLFVLSSVPTVLSNRDPVWLAAEALPGLRFQDIVSAAGTQAILLVPYLLGRHFLATAAGHRDLLAALLIGGVAYSFPALAEVRLSPFLNIWVYGFFQHDFSQMIRYGGFRPIVFLPHAIWLAVFMMMALVAAVVLLREAPATERRQRAWLWVAVVWLIGVLILCKTLSALFYALLALPLVACVAPRHWVRAAAALALVAVSYPLLRGLELVPLEAIVQWVGSLDEARATSLAFRFENEERLLARAAERPVFGWGGWERNLLHHYFTGEITAISDGRWIIVFGIYGWLGYLAEFGLLALPLALLWLRMRREGGAVSPHVAATALLLALNLLDLLPNGTLEPLTWLMAGAVLGHAERVLAATQRPVAVVRARPRRRTVI